MQLEMIGAAQFCPDIKMDQNNSIVSISFVVKQCFSFYTNKQHCTSTSKLINSFLQIKKKIAPLPVLVYNPTGDSEHMLDNTETPENSCSAQLSSFP